MPTEEITIRVDPEAARLYKSASEAERRKLDILLNLRLREVRRSTKSLEEIMDQMSREAQARGLTPEILQAILDER